MRFLAYLAIAGLICFFFGCNRSRNEEKKETPPEFKSTPADQDKRPVIVTFGNSLTAGPGVDPSENYPSRLQALLDNSGYSYRVVNAGVSGETSAQGLNRIQSIIDLHPAVVIVEFGANDGLRGLPVETIRRNLADIVARLQASGARVVLAGMRVPPNYGPQFASAFGEIYQKVASQYKVALIPFFLEGVGGHAELNQDDGIHPTAEGYGIVVKNVWSVLQPLLRKD
jgi:acyl-CoA thioesterase I